MSILAPQPYTVFLDHLQPTPRLWVDEWADENRYLDSRDSKEHGKYKSSRTPHAIDIMRDLSPQSPIEMVAVRKSAQVAMTQIGINMLGCYADIKPGPMMLVMPTLESVRRTMKFRIRPMIQTTPSLLEKIGSLGSSAVDNAAMIEYPGGYLNVVTAGSADALSSMPMMIILLDEYDRYSLEAGDQGDQLEQALARTLTYIGRRKIFIPSTPANKGSSKIDALIESMPVVMFPEVPCPYCGSMQPLYPDGLIIPDYDLPRENVHFECVSCRRPIESKHKAKMIKQIRWSAHKGEKTIRTRRIGYDNLWAAYTPIGLGSSWEDISEDQVRAERSGKIEIEKTFENLTRGRSYELKGERPDYEKLYNRRESYRADVPAGALIITAGTDVQDMRLETGVWGWGTNDECWLIEKVVFYGDTSERGPGSTWERLDNYLLNRRFKHEGGAEVRIRMCGLDTGGHRTNEAYLYAKDRKSYILPMKGRGNLDTYIGTPTRNKIYHPITGKELKTEAIIYPIGDSLLKHQLYRYLAKKPNVNTETGEITYPTGYIHFPRFMPGGISLDLEFMKQMTAESYVLKNPKKPNGPKEWKKTYERNEGIDNWKMARAVLTHLGYDRTSEKEFEKKRKNLCGDATRSDLSKEYLEETLQQPEIIEEQKEDNIPTPEQTLAQQESTPTPPPKKTKRKRSRSASRGAL